MANPQKENGYTAVANEILEQICHYRISGEEHLVMWSIIRKTYGFTKKEDHIALSQFQEMTRLKKPTIQRAITKLLSKKIIIINKDNKLGNLYKFNKNFDEWVELSKKITEKKVINKDNKRESIKITRGASLLRHTKEYIKRKKESATTEVVAVVIPKKKEIPLPVLFTKEMLEERLLKMEQVEGSYLDIIATYIREKPVAVENSKQLSLVIARFARIAKAAEGAYTNEQITKAIDEIKNDNAWRKRKGEAEIDWTVETIIKKLVKK